MAFSLGPLGQVTLPISDVGETDAFYGGKLGLRKLFGFGHMTFYDCAGVRLMLSRPENGAAVTPGSPLYFRVADIALARRELEGRGVAFIDQIHLVAPMEDHDLWMTFCEDPDRNLIALMAETPKGYKPA